MTRRARLAAAALAIGLLAAGPAALAADGSGRPGQESGGQSAGPGTAAASITHVEAAGGTVQVLVSVPADAQVDLTKVGLTIGGVAAKARASAADGDTTVRRTAILVIDTSESMRGARFTAARAAARAFVGSVPDDVYVGIESFAGDVHTDLAPTQDRQSALDVLGRLRLSRQTRLYDGVVQAVDLAGTQGQRSLLVLSDGADTSTTSITQATSAIKDAGVLTDVVALDQDGADLTKLTALARAGHGQVISADPEALQATFAAEAAVLARQVQVTATVPPSVTGTQATVAVTLPTSTGVTLSAQAFGSIRSGSHSLTPVAVATSGTSSGWTAPGWVGVAGPGALGVGLVLMVLLLAPRRVPLSPAERIERFTAARHDAAPGTTLMDTDVTFATTKEAAAMFLRRNRDLDERISRRLSLAGSELRSSEWLLVHAGTFFLAGVLGVLVTDGNLVVGIVFMTLGAVGPYAYLLLRASRRRKAFHASLPDTLQLISGSLSAGLSLAQSVDTIVREGQEPIASEFRRVLVETRLGVGLEDAFEGVAQRFDSKDFAWAVMAIRIQRQVGGNLGELLDTVAGTMREREYLRRQVAALAAEGKLSAYVLGALPPLFMLYLLLTNYAYVSIMFHRPLGWAMLTVGGLILAIGALWMSKLVKVEV